MLLLLFFTLTTKFTTEEKVIGGLLPSTKGDGVAQATVTPVIPIAICIYPAGFDRGYSPAQYEAQLAARGDGVFTGKAWLRIGQREPLAIDGNLLRDARAGQAAGLNPEVERIHGYIAKALGDYEKSGARSAQDPVTIASFSGMSWKFALVAYDAVRAYEAGKVPVAATAGEAVVQTPEMLQAAREVDFLPPSLRSASAHELGEELGDILRR
jgi:hypothetical protein